MTPHIKMATDFWCVALFLGTSDACPHATDDEPATFTTSDSVYRCRTCTEDNPPPPNLACDRCAAGEDHGLVTYRTLPIEGVTVVGALCPPCINALLNGDPMRQDTPMRHLEALLRDTGDDTR